MTFAPQCVRAETPLAEAADRMAELRIGCLPVVESQGGLVGILSETDALRALAATLWTDELRARRCRDDRSRHAGRAAARRARAHRARAARATRETERRFTTHPQEEPVDFAERAADRSEAESAGILQRARRAAPRRRSTARSSAPSTGGSHFCERCGRRIPLARLQALPGTTLCIACAHASRAVARPWSWSGPSPASGSTTSPLVGGKNASFGEMIRALGAARRARAGRLRARPPTPIARCCAAPGVRRGGARRAARPRRDATSTRCAWRARAAGARCARRRGRDELSRELAPPTRSSRAATARTTTDVAVRSSATAEDLPGASFAGQQETYLNVRGLAQLERGLPQVLRLALHGSRHLVPRRARLRPREGPALGRRAEDGALGPGRLGRDLHARHRERLRPRGPDHRHLRTRREHRAGRGEPGRVRGLQADAGRDLAAPRRKEIAHALRRGRRPRHAQPAGAGVAARPVRADAARRRASWRARPIAIEKHYSARAGEPRPMDIEWAKDGRSGELFILQARPETAHARRDPAKLVSWRLLERGPLRVRGRAVGTQIGAGPVVRLEHAAQARDFAPGSVLVTGMTDPDWEPILKRAAAIVTDRGGRTCHAAIVARELGIPCVVGTGNATALLAPGEPVTVSCAEGETGLVMQGVLRFEKQELDMQRAAGDAHADPRERRQSRAGLRALLPARRRRGPRARGVHHREHDRHPPDGAAAPRAHRRGDAARDRRAHARLPGRRRFFEQRLAEGVARIAAAFHPRPVIVRLSDFKTNEYAGPARRRALRAEGGEPDARLPRRLALRARRLPRGLRARVPRAAARARGDGARQRDRDDPVLPHAAPRRRPCSRRWRSTGSSAACAGSQLYAMCEIPSNVLLMERFAELFDGFSIGSNDLTQLVLGVDRDSEILAGSFDERDPAVLRALSMAIEGAHRAGRKIGICGQAPSDHPEVAEFLVRAGIDSLSLSADAVVSRRACASPSSRRSSRRG